MSRDITLTQLSEARLHTFQIHRRSHRKLLNRTLRFRHGEAFGRLLTLEWFW
jgi:hypothetical protein